MFPFSIQVSMKRLTRLMNDFNVLSAICTYQIAESIFVMFLSVLLIGGHYKGEKTGILKFVPLVPSGIFMAGVFFTETYLFNAISCLRFRFLAMAVSGVVFILLFSGALTARKLFARWEWRMEMKIILSFFQMLLAMFLPLILMGVKIGGTQLKVDIRTAVTILPCMLIVVVTGALYRIRKNGRCRL
ncbi:MAG: hypothetical protein U9R44_05665 [Candidatus Omnitrophota bacterium]|nr:hypothetical protein [Candidatus Omnitrophota bacterium]